MISSSPPASYAIVLTRVYGMLGIFLFIPLYLSTYEWTNQIHRPFGKEGSSLQTLNDKTKRW